MKRVSLLSLTCALAGLVTGCLDSPLLNHADADTVRIQRNAVRAAAPGCQFELIEQGLCASLEWKTQPALEEDASFTLRFWNPRIASQHGPYVTPPLSVAVKLWMPDMGHGTRAPKVSAAKDASGAALPGVFDVNEVNFIMGGHWEIFVQLKKDKLVVSQSKIGIDL